MAVCVWACVATVMLALCRADDVTFYSPMSSSYARVQYTNNNNSVIRRLGAHRDPTIRYVNFDELYNKHNSNGNQNSGRKNADQSQYDVNVTSDWKVENQPETVTSTVPSTSSNVKPTRNNNGAVYFPGGNDAIQTTNYDQQSNSYADGSALGTAEYAHYTNVGNVPSSVAPPVVMEASWTGQQDRIDNFQSVKTTQQTLSNQGVASNVNTMSQTSLKRNGNSVQDGWIPFGGPAPANTEQPLMATGDDQDNRQPFEKVSVFGLEDGQNVDPPGASFQSPVENEINRNEASLSALQPPAPSSASGNFINERQPNMQQFQLNNNRFEKPDSLSNDRPQTMPTFEQQNHQQFQLQQQQNQQQFQLQQQQRHQQQWADQFQNSDDSDNRNKRPLPFGMRIPSNLRPEVPPQDQWPEVERPSRQPEAETPNQRPETQPHNRWPVVEGPNRRQNQLSWPNQWPDVESPNRRPEAVPNIQRPDLGQPNRRQQIPTANQWPEAEPQNQRPETAQMPSRPVGLPPQLWPNQVQQEQNHLTLRLPLPKPGVGLGSSPQNPLPGPPIFFPQETPGDDGPQTPNSPVQMDGQFNQAQSHFRPPGQMRFQPPPHFRPPPPPPTTTQSSLIKSFFRRIFPFGRSMRDDGDDVLVVDDNEKRVTTLYVTASPLNVTTNDTATTPTYEDHSV